MRRQNLLLAVSIVIAALLAFTQLGFDSANAQSAPAGDSEAPAEPAADVEPAAPAAPAADPPTQPAAGDSKAEAAAVRLMCEAALKKDPAWRAELRNSMRAAVHQEDANLMMTNKKHVVAAYTVLWVLTVVFLVLMFGRQRKLTAEIASLRDDLEKAIKDD